MKIVLFCKVIVLLLFLQCFAQFNSYSQTITRTYYDVLVHTYNRRYMFVGEGLKRNFIRIELPSNIKQWKVQGKTVSESDIQPIKLQETMISELDRLTSRKYSTISVSDIKTKKVEGEFPVSVYLGDQSNYQKFLRRDDHDMYKGEKIKLPILVSNQKQFSFDLINPKSNVIYLCFETSGSGYVQFDIVGLKNVHQNMDDWDEANKEKAYQYCLKNGIQEESHLNEICSCYSEKVADSYSPRQYFNMREVDRVKIDADLWNSCMNSIPDDHYEGKVTKVNRLLTVAQEQFDAKDFASSEKTYKELITMGRASDDEYNRLAETQFLQGKMKDFQESTYMGLSLKKSNLFLNAKLIRIYLLKGDISSAKKVYSNFSKFNMKDGTKFGKYLLKEIDYMKSLGLGNKSMDDFQKYLKSNPS